MEYILIYSKDWDKLEKLSIENISDNTKKVINISNPESERIFKPGVLVKGLKDGKIKAGRKMFPAAISNFVRGTRLEGNKINALLMIDRMLISEATMAKDDYDQVVFGEFTQPYKALEGTKPIVIIDEPHRFRKGNLAYKTLVQKLKPQLIIRFGATFPDLPKNP